MTTKTGRKGKLRAFASEADRIRYERLKVAGWVFQISCIPLLLIILGSISAPYLDAWITQTLGINMGEHSGGEMAKNLQAAVLPLVSGWIGAVIAYYFVTNAQAQTTESVQNLVGGRGFAQRLKSTPLSRIMLPAAEVTGIELGAETTAIMRLEEIFSPPEGKGPARTRAVIFERANPSGRRVRSVIHMSTYYEFIARRTGNDTPRERLTVEDLLRDPETQRRIENGTAWLAETETLEHAQQVMKRMPAVQDLIITRSGRSDEPMVGYMTNGDVLRHCVARAEAPDDGQETSAG